VTIVTTVAHRLAEAVVPFVDADLRFAVVSPDEARR
jgi:hypothetical protein